MTKAPILIIRAVGGLCLLATACGLLATACARPYYTATQRAAVEAPVTLGEGNTGKPPLPEPGSEPLEPARASVTSPTGFDPSAQPDPPPTETLAYFAVELRYCEGNVHFVGAKKVQFERATTLPSKMGRFAIELWIGRELLERARFDFPLLGAETNEQGLKAPAQFGPNADVSWTVAVSERERTNQAWVVDRLTGKRWDLDWPPGDQAGSNTATRRDGACPGTTTNAE